MYATALRETGTRSFTNRPGIFKIELDPVHVSTIPGLDAFYSIGPFEVSHAEDLVAFGGSQGYPAGPCGVYAIRLPAGEIRAAIETSDCRAGSPWRVLSLLPDGTEALISANHSLALLDLAQGSITKIEGQLSRGSFSPDGRWIAALQLGDPKVPRPACPSQNPLALETLEVQTGNRSLIRDSICNSGSSRQIGWVRSDIKR